MEKGKPSQHSILYNEIFLSQEIGLSHKVAVLFYLRILADNLANALGKWGVGERYENPESSLRKEFVNYFLGGQRT